MSANFAVCYARRVDVREASALEAGTSAAQDKRLWPSKQQRVQRELGYGQDDFQTRKRLDKRLDHVVASCRRGLWLRTTWTIRRQALKPDPDRRTTLRKTLDTRRQKVSRPSPRKHPSKLTSPIVLQRPVLRDGASVGAAMEGSADGRGLGLAHDLSDGDGGPIHGAREGLELGNDVGGRSGEVAREKSGARGRLDVCSEMCASGSDLDAGRCAGAQHWHYTGSALA